MDDRVAKLLLKAVRTLPQREQDQVLTALLREALSESAPVAGALPSPTARDVVMLAEAPPMVVPPGVATSGPAAMLPVRLPPELHERLRRWSTEQGFSMAGVVRGLVERFLDQQAKAATRSIATARKRVAPRRSTRPPTARD